MLESYEETALDDGKSELIFRVDEDDWESRLFLSEHGHEVMVGPRLEGYRSLPTFFNELAKVASGDVVMCGNDDMVFRTPRWDSLMLDVANRYPDGIFDLGVSTHNHENFPFATVSKKVVDKFGFFFDPRIFWGDVFLLGVMAAFNRAIFLPNVVIDHDWMGFHPDATFADGDTVRRSNWMTYHQQAIDEAVEKLSRDEEVRKLRWTTVPRHKWLVNTETAV